VTVAPVRRRSIVPLLGLVLVSIAATLALLEGLLRLSGYSATPVDIQIGQQGDQRSFHVFEDQNFEYDPVLIWRPRAGLSVFNRQGFRGPVLADVKKPGELRVFAVGDSNTLGWAGANGPNWPEDLQALVRSVQPDSTVVNAGVWGYASYQGLQRFRQTLAFHPDIVLISFGSNDAHWVVQSDKDYKAQSFRESEAARALASLRLGELVLSAMDRFSRRGANGPGPRVSLDDYRANLTTMVAEAREHGVRIVLLTRPYVGPIDNPTWWKNRGADYNGATADIAREQSVPLIDVYSFFKGRDELFADESHFTAEGHVLAAQVVFDRLKPVIAAVAGAPATPGSAGADAMIAR
jgi:lysophospholipase L1-like esterase